MKAPANCLACSLGANHAPDDIDSELRRIT
jgi:hypothetical protein